MIVVGCMNAVTSKSWFTKIQRFVTGKNVSHSFLILDEYYGDYQMLDARLSVTLCPFELINNDGNDIWLYKIDISEKNSNKIKETFFNEYIGQTYGFSQLIWFIWRRLMELIFKKDMRNKKNWFSEGILCSELVWNVLDKCSKFEDEDKKFQDINLELSKYNVNSFHSGDCKELLDSLSDKNIISKITINEFHSL